LTPVIRIDDEVMEELKKKAIQLDLVFASPNTTLRQVFGLDTNLFSDKGNSNIVENDTNITSGEGYTGKEGAGMATLVINAPEYQAGKKSFSAVLVSLIGQGYILSDRDKGKLQIPGSPVVLLAKDLRRRAEGRLTKLVPTYKSNSGRQRYDVQVDKWTEVPYKSEDLNRCGVAII